MSVQSNIGEYYNELVKSLAERAKMIHDEEAEKDREDCVWQALDEGMIYHVDQAYMIAYAWCSGVRDEEEAWAGLYDDVYKESKNKWEEE